MDNTGHSDAVGSDVERVSQWIPVTERLPEEETIILGWFPYWNSIFMVEYSPDYGWIEGGDAMDCDPTHWMPLPNPPRS